MELRFSPAEQQLREQVEAFLAEALPPGWHGEGGEDADEEWQVGLELNRRLSDHGWMAPAWPREYGGMAAGYIEQLIFNEAFAYHRAPGGGRLFSVGLVGPTIIHYGDERQKREHLPAITRAELYWCRGFSEPGAGSDLASLQTRAVRDGDEYVINGQKIWTSQAQRADMMLLLARTDPEAPKHKGISCFLLPMRTAGVAVRPLINLAGRHSFNEIFLTDVRVPLAARLGEENRGWYIATTTLDYERSSIAGSAGGRRNVEELVEHAAECPARRRAAVRSGLAERWVETEVGRMLSYRVAGMQARGLVPNAEASAAKLYAGELTQRIARFGVSVLGLYGQLRNGGRWARLKGRFAEQLLVTVGTATIAGGTSEVQRNIIATRGLGLPRG